MKPGRNNTSRILVVDDDYDIRELVATMLSDQGFVVETAASAREALSILEAAPFDLMVTDIALPGGLNGAELVAYARKRRPSLKSLFISGRSEPVVVEPTQDDFVAKPFRPRELLGCVYELLARELAAQAGLPRCLTAEEAIVEAKVACLRRQWGQ